MLHALFGGWRQSALRIAHYGGHLARSNEISPAASASARVCEIGKKVAAAALRPSGVMTPAARAGVPGVENDDEIK